MKLSKTPVLNRTWVQALWNVGPMPKRAPLEAPAAAKAGANVVITANAVIVQATAAPSHQSPRAVAVLGARQPQPLVIVETKAQRAPLAAPAAAKAGANVVITVNAVIAQATVVAGPKTNLVLLVAPAAVKACANAVITVNVVIAQATAAPRQIPWAVGAAG